MADLPDITSPDVYSAGAPHDRFRWLRRHAPVSFHPDEHDGHWALVRHADVVRASRQWEVFSSAWGSTLEEMTDDELAARRSLMDLDPPAHSRLRRLLGKGYTPRVVASYETAFRTMTRELLTAALGRPGVIDLVEAVSKPLPALWLCRHLGLPDEMVAELVRWSDHMLMGASDPDHFEDRTDPQLRFAPFGSRAGAECVAYAARIAAERRASPRDDVITQVLYAEPGGEPLSDAEFRNFFSVLAIAGQEASRHATTAGALALIDHPDQLDLLTDRPELIDPAVEEILRWSTPIHHFRRTTTAPVEVGGVAIPDRARVTLWYISANFDEAVFEEPAAFDIARSPNDHIAFGGGGPHYCLGAALGRLQVKVTVSEMLPFLDRITPAGAPVPLRSNLIHGMKRAPIRIASAQTPTEPGPTR